MKNPVLDEQDVQFIHMFLAQMTPPGIANISKVTGVSKYTIGLIQRGEYKPLVKPVASVKRRPRVRRQLSAEDVHLIRRLLSLRMTATKIGRKFRVPGHVIADISAGRSYVDVPVVSEGITPDDIRATGRWDKILKHDLHGLDVVAGLGVDRLPGKRTWLKDHGMSIANRSASLRRRKHPYGGGSPDGTCQTGTTGPIRCTIDPSSGEDPIDRVLWAAAQVIEIKVWSLGVYLPDMTYEQIEEICAALCSIGSWRASEDGKKYLRVLS